MLPYIGIEMTVYLSKVSKMPNWFTEIVAEFKSFESKHRLMVDLPASWEGFTDGTVFKILEFFNEGVYFALAYYTDSVVDVVTDFYGKPVDKFDSTFNGLKVFKYVKKRLCVVERIDPSVGSFKVKGYVLNLKYTEPVLTVLDVYSVGSVSGVTLARLGLE